MMLKQNNVGAHSTVIFLASINCFAMVSFLAVICKTVLKKKQKKCDTAVPILTSLLTCSVMVSVKKIFKRCVWTKDWPRSRDDLDSN